MKGEQGRGGAVKVFCEVPKDRVAATPYYMSCFALGTFDQARKERGPYA
jgi:hypothetical protein